MAFIGENVTVKWSAIRRIHGAGGQVDGPRRRHCVRLGRHRTVPRR